MMIVIFVFVFVFFVVVLITFFFFKQKTAYEMRISDWSSDVCSSDLPLFPTGVSTKDANPASEAMPGQCRANLCAPRACGCMTATAAAIWISCRARSEEHTSELQSLMRISYAVFCLKKKNTRPERRHK